MYAFFYWKSMPKVYSLYKVNEQNKFSLLGLNFSPENIQNFVYAQFCILALVF